MGIGTTATVAKALGRDYIGIELNDEYINIAERRLVLQQEEINRKANKKPRFENIDMKGK
jgi:DNA modification methylase